MTFSEKFKAINNKIEQIKAQYSLDRLSAKISALSSGNVSKYKSLTGKEVLPKKYLLEKAATIKRFEYSALEEELKAQTDISKDQYKFFKAQKSNIIDNKEEDMSDEDKKDESKTFKRFDIILKDIKNVINY